MNSARRFDTSAVVLATIVVLAVTALAFIVSRDPSRPDMSTLPELATPCGGTEMSLAAAGEAVTFDLIQPQAPLANSDRLVSVWACTTTAEGIGFVYDSGVAVLESPSDLKDPEATWRRMADLYPEFSVREIHGVPVSIADPAVDGAIGGADFVVGGVRYTVSGNGKIPLEDLVVVGDSLVAEALK